MHQLLKLILPAITIGPAIIASSAGPTGRHHCAAAELIVDGTFDDGSLWESEARGDGRWSLSPVGDFTPISAFPTSDQGGGLGDYAVSDQQGSATTALFQAFTVPLHVSHITLAYDMFVNDWSNQPSFNSDQHARVDIMGVDSSPLDNEGVVFNAYLGTDGGPLPNPFRHYEFDITPFVTPGEQYRVRFLATNMLDNLNQGIDNVSILAIPEPSAHRLALWGVGLFLLALPYLRLGPHRIGSVVRGPWSVVRGRCLFKPLTTTVR